MAEAAGGSVATILFTDVVDSTVLMQRLGDERAQSVFERHRRMLVDTLGASGGEDLQWLGDGQMAAFASPADAVRCAVAMQQGAVRQIDGERLRIRVGLNVGEIMRGAGGGYFGTPVVTARRLCDAAEAGQILCGSTVAGLLAGRRAFRFRDLGPQTLKGLAEPVGAAEVEYDAEEPTAFLATTPFVGRDDEMARLVACLRRAQAGDGGLVMVVGEPGIGKSRTAEELAELARREGARVISGRCYEGEWTPPYGPFVEVIAGYARAIAPEDLRADLGHGAPPLARLVPSLRERFPDIPEPVPLQADEERLRLLDAVSQLLVAASERAPVVLVLEDLHWADRDTIAMLRHVARAVSQHRLLVLGLYRDVELDRQHPLADALGALRREAPYERIALRGLDTAGVEALLEAVAQHDVNPALVRAISEETDGNPFFIREVLIHLVEEGKLYREGGRWTSRVASVAELGIPEGVRQVITRRLSRLSETANKLLSAASAFEGVFRFDIAAGAAGLDETVALDAVDEALGTQLLRATGEVDFYDFTHALIRHTLYAELNPSRQVRLHRRIAEATERLSPDRAADIAYHYHQSAAVPGAERGVAHALAAADRAEAAYAWDDLVTFLRMALELVLAGDARDARIRARLGLALTRTLAFDEALGVAREAISRLAATAGAEAATDYEAAVAYEMVMAGFMAGAWELAAHGLRSVGGRRDLTWAKLQWVDLWLESTGGVEVGMFLPTPAVEELRRVVQTIPDRAGAEILSYLSTLVPQFSSRAVALERAKQHDEDPFAPGAPMLFWIGDFRGSVQAGRADVEIQEQEGKVSLALAAWAYIARSHLALGELAAADAAYERGRLLAARVTRPSAFTLQLDAYDDERREASGEGWAQGLEQFAAPAREPIPEDRWALAAIRAGVARVYAWMGQPDSALALVEATLPALERAPASAGNYTRVACTAAEALWRLGGTDFIAIIERSLRDKVVESDFRYPMVDARLALAWMCALTGRHGEASDWFARARAVLEEQGARPLRAIADFDEALMFQRSGAPGDRGRALALLDRARKQFEDIGMSGWLRYAAQLAAMLEARS